MNNDLYEHEAVQQLAKEYGLTEITPRDISEAKITCFLRAIETERMNPKHDPPAEWVKSFFMFLRQTGKYPELLKSPNLFVEEIIQDILNPQDDQNPLTTAMSEIEIQGCKNLNNLLTSACGLIEMNESAKAIERLQLALAELDKMFRGRNKRCHC
jgi:hypothetical protein